MPQRKPKVSEPGEPMEREADAVASRVTSSPDADRPMRLTTARGAAAQRAGEEEIARAADEDVARAGDEEIARAGDEEVARAGDEEVARAADEEVARAADDEVARAGDEEVARAGDEEVARAGEGAGGGGGGAGGGAPRVTARTSRTIANPGSGSPMPHAVRHRIEPHLGVGLGGVRVHQNRDASSAASSLHARAFTVGNDIFLSSRESPQDVGLMAHESTHVVQQGAAGAGLMAARAPEDIQRLPDFITDKLADYAHYVPGYDLLTYIIEYDPLRGERVEPTAMSLVKGLMGLLAPVGAFVFDQLVELGILQAAFEFVTGELARFDLSLERLERTISEAWDATDFVRLDPFDYNLGVLKRHFGRLLDDVTGFASSVISALVDLIKEALIGVAEELLAENKAWDLIKKILHYDPLRGETVDAPTVEILEDFLMLIGREQELEQMRTRGTLQQTADWLDTQFATFAGLLTQLSSLFTDAWAAIQPANLPDLPTTLPALVVRVGEFLQSVWDFAVTVATEVIQLIKDSLLGWLASFVDEVPGFHLLTVILGRNPFTGEPVPRTAVNIIRGFITLLPGGNAIYDRLAETGIIGEAGARIEGAMSSLGISWEFIVGLFTGLWDTVVSIETLIDPIGVFTQIRGLFGEPVSRLFAFIRVVLRTMFELLLALMNFPTDLLGRIIDNAMQAYEHIKRDPIGFLINMLQAVKLGFSNFFDNILDHLVSGLADWLFKGLREAGIEPPEDLSFESILDVVLQVLGISVDRIWEKLAQRFGQETVDKIRTGMEYVTGIWTLVKDVSERGISALWEYVQDQLSNLWTTVLDAATDWIMEQIIGRVTAKLLSMLDPTGIMAVVNGFIAFFNAIQSAIEYIRDILEIVDSYVATLAAVAAGDIEPGAARMEGGLAAAIPIAIGFLANQVGIGNIGEKMTEIIGRIREVVDQALDWLLDKLAAMVDRVLAMLGVGGDPEAADEAAAAEEAGADPADHSAFARHALTRLATGAANVSDLAGIRTVAESLAPTLSAQLKPGIGLHYQFIGGADDVADGLVTVRVVIAPNDTVEEEELPVGDCYSPGKSAPGVGETQPHGAKPSSNRSGPAIHHTESEHIIPYAIGDALLEVLGLSQGSRTASRKFDGALTTVMLYKGAANEKTRGDPTADLPQIRQFKQQMRNADVGGRLESGEHFAQAGGGITAESQSVYADVTAAIERVRADAETRTNKAVENEWKSPTEGCSMGNGARRGEKAAIPDETVIKDVSKKQYGEIFTFARHLFEARGERPISTPDNVPAAVDQPTLAQLNTMRAQGEFMLIRGVGPTLAAALAQARANSEWHHRDDLLAVPGIGPTFVGRVR